MNRQERLEKLFQTMEAITRWKAYRQRREPMPVGVPTNTRLSVLTAIAFEEAKTIKDLAQRFRMTSSAATQLVNSLSEEGLVTRKKDTEDRRKTELSLTPGGKKILLVAKKHCFTILAELFESLSEKDLQSLQHIQEKIVNHLHSVWTTPENPNNL